jgi:hypothetical protein
MYRFVQDLILEELKKARKRGELGEWFDLSSSRLPQQAKWDFKKVTLFKISDEENDRKRRRILWTLTFLQLTLNIRSI